MQWSLISLLYWSNLCQLLSKYCSFPKSFLKVLCYNFSLNASFNHFVLCTSEKVLPETVVILADENLLRLPLESLSVFKSSQVHCLARDLSLQMHFHRFHSTDNSGIKYRSVRARFLFSFPVTFSSYQV